MATSDTMATFDDWDKLEQEYIDRGNKLVSDWLYAEANITPSDDEAWDNKQVENWIKNNIKTQFGNDVVDEIYGDVLDGCVLGSNGNYEVDRVYKQINAISLKNTKSILQIQMPLSNQTVVNLEDGSTWLLPRDIDSKSRSLQFNHMKMMFGIDEPLLKMCFEEKCALKETDVTDHITDFLNKCSDINSPSHCIQATIILNGHGTESGEIRLEKKTMQFSDVMKHVEKSVQDIWYGQIEKGLPQLPYGVKVLNGVCYSYKRIYDSSSTRIQKKIFTSTCQEKTSNVYRVAKSTAPSGDIKYELEEAFHSEINEYACKEFIEEVDDITRAKFVIIGRFVKPDAAAKPVDEYNNMRDLSNLESGKDLFYLE